eukprot:4025158-Amphidinium_carterae.1
MAQSNDDLRTSSAASLQTDTCPGEPFPKRPKVAEELHLHSSDSASGVPGAPAHPKHQQYVAQRCWIFQQRGTVANRCPDNWPFAGHSFEEGKNYSRVPDGQPIPYEEWWSRCYKSLDLDMDPYTGPFPNPVVSCNECHRFGGPQVPLGQCICCDNWGCPEHLVAPVCLPVLYPMCRNHPQVERRPEANFQYLAPYWD